MLNFFWNEVARSFSSSSSRDEIDDKLASHAFDSKRALNIYGKDIRATILSTNSPGKVTLRCRRQNTSWDIGTEK